MGRGSKRADGAGRPAPSALSFTEQLAAAREATLRLLAVRERSAAELRTRLRTRGFDPEVIDQTLERMAASGLQSDVRFAERFAQDIGAARGWSSRRTKTELLGRGLSRELADAVVAQDPEGDRDRALEVARKRVRRMAGLAPDVRVRRLAGLLARRGYGSDICLSVALEVSGAEVDEDGIP